MLDSGFAHRLIRFSSAAGANRYCIDKNYGQTFIIFDRLFGTFAEERDDEPLVYGTLGQMDRNSAIMIQVSPGRQRGAQLPLGC